jgi:hypothetical protein
MTQATRNISVHSKSKKRSRRAALTDAVAKRKRLTPKTVMDMIGSLGLTQRAATSQRIHQANGRTRPGPHFPSSQRLRSPPCPGRLLLFCLERLHGMSERCELAHHLRADFRRLGNTLFEIRGPSIVQHMIEGGLSGGVLWLRLGCLIALAQGRGCRLFGLLWFCRRSVELAQDRIQISSRRSRRVRLLSFRRSGCFFQHSSGGPPCAPPLRILSPPYFHSRAVVRQT